MLVCVCGCVYVYLGVFRAVLASESYGAALAAAAPCRPNAVVHSINHLKSAMEGILFTPAHVVSPGYQVMGIGVRHRRMAPP